MGEIKRLQKEALKIAIKNGFYNSPVIFIDELLEIKKEIYEAMDAVKKSRFFYKTKNRKTIPNLISLNSKFDKIYFESEIKDTYQDELADIIIRTISLAAATGVDIEFHIKAKMKYNKIREYNKEKI